MKIYLTVIPSPKELAEAREQLTRESCPRRYCWYWHTLAFDWELNPEEGCEVAERHVHRLLLEREQGSSILPWQQCCRATGNPQHRDYYEPREPHLEEDGWSEDYFQIVGKIARRGRFARRQRGRTDENEDRFLAESESQRSYSNRSRINRIVQAQKSCPVLYAKAL